MGSRCKLPHLGHGQRSTLHPLRFRATIPAGSGGFDLRSSMVTNGSQRARVKPAAPRKSVGGN